jgi:hypothetical protein
MTDLIYGESASPHGRCRLINVSEVSCLVQNTYRLVDKTTKC